MPTKLNRITVCLTDEQVATLPPARTLAQRVLLALGFPALKIGGPRAGAGRKPQGKLQPDAPEPAKPTKGWD